MKHPIGTTVVLAMLATAIAMPGLAADQPAAPPSDFPRPAVPPPAVPPSAVLAPGAVQVTLTVTMHKATQDGTGEALGTVVISATKDGATFNLHLHGLPPGPHGFHVHENANCSPTFLYGVRIPAGAAGGHFDPDETGKHAGPMGDGHLGDLPVLEVQSDGTATRTLTAPRIKSIDVLRGHSLIIHIGGDNYSDSPSLLGGGGGRLACGLVE
jgi:Cu-Zn family superoxide dismutase